MSSSRQIKDIINRELKNPQTNSRTNGWIDIWRWSEYVQCLWDFLQLPHANTYTSIRRHSYIYIYIYECLRMLVYVFACGSCKKSHKHWTYSLHLHISIQPLVRELVCGFFNSLFIMSFICLDDDICQVFSPASSPSRLLSSYGSATLTSAAPNFRYSLCCCCYFGR